MEKTKESRIEFRVKSEEKDKISERAESAGMSVSDFCRVQALSDNKLIVLNKGGEIAKSLTQLSIDLERALRGKEIQAPLERKLLESFNDLWVKFDEISEELTDIRNYESEAD